MDAARNQAVYGKDQAPQHDWTIYPKNMKTTLIQFALDANAIAADVDDLAVTLQSDKVFGKDASKYLIRHTPIPEFTHESFIFMAEQKEKDNYATFWKAYRDAMPTGTE